MVTVVVVINMLISLMLLYVAWRVWQLKQKIEFIGDRLTEYERCTHDLLYKAPENIYLGQNSIQQLRQSNQVLQLQIQQIRQIISILLLGRRTWQRYFRKMDFISRK
jgi:predicted negative regulator of RcsB-dependent stress response